METLWRFLGMCCCLSKGYSGTLLPTLCYLMCFRITIPILLKNITHFLSYGIRLCWHSKMARKHGSQQPSRICPEGDRQCECSKNSLRLFANHGLLWDGKALYKQKVICLCFILKINMLLMKIWPFLLAKNFRRVSFFSTLYN